MPNIKSAKKRVLVTEKKTQQNKAIKSALKTSIKKFLAAVNAGEKESATALYPETVSAIDSAVTNVRTFAGVFFIPFFRSATAKLTA